SKPGAVWFATHEQIARYVKEPSNRPPVQPRQRSDVTSFRVGDVALDDVGDRLRLLNDLHPVSGKGVGIENIWRQQWIGECLGKRVYADHPADERRHGGVRPNILGE